MKFRGFMDLNLKNVTESSHNGSEHVKPQTHRMGCPVFEMLNPSISLTPNPTTCPHPIPRAENETIIRGNGDYPTKR
jgi:hypothetical protein